MSETAKTVVSALAGLCLVTAARADKPDIFVDVGAAVPGVILDVRYYGRDNFVGAPVEGYEAPRCFLTRPAADGVVRAQAEAARQGLTLKIFDCYRPTRAVAHFARWAADLSDQRMKAIYYPDVDKRDLFALGYIADRSGHSRGSTLDLTLADPATGRELDMGTHFDLFSALSWPDSPAVSPEQRANRQRLAGLMIKAGFTPFDKEWWHFTLANEPFTDTYFDFPIR